MNWSASSAPLWSRGTAIGGGKTAVMGILNVTPDSFSDGGLWIKPSDAVAHGVHMHEEGAALIDVGGESTRPGARRVSDEEEWQRVGTVIRDLVREGVPVSIDTVHAATAQRAIDLGAILVNDVSGGSVDPGLIDACAATGTALVVQHWRGFPSDPALNSTYEDVVREVAEETLRQADRALAHGVGKNQIALDPGLGFALGAQDSWRIVEALTTLTALGFPVLVGASRKRFVVARYGDAVEQGTLDVTAQCVRSGVWAVRVHDVAPNVRLIDELWRAREEDCDE